MNAGFTEKTNSIIELSATYLISILFLYLATHFLKNGQIFQIEILDKLIFLTTLLIIFFLSIIMIQKIILLQNIKPYLTQKEAKKIFDKIKKLNIKNKKKFLKYKKLEKEINFHEIQFKTFLEFFLFSTTIMAISLMSLMPIKQSFKNLFIQIKNILRKNPKPNYFAWRVFLNNKTDKEKLYFFYSFPRR
jgi:hypothetical protein